MADSDKNIRITTSKNKPSPAKPQIVFTGAAAGSSVITLEVLDDNTLSFSSNEGQVFSLDSNLTVGTIWSVNDVSGVPMLRSSAGTTVGIAEYSGVVGIGETDPKHKLSVKGGLGIGSTNSTAYTVFRFPSAGTGQTYVLPTGYPGTGTSVLASDTAGNMSWVASSGGGSGSGTTSLNVNVTQATTNAVHRVVFTPAITTVAGAALSTNSTLSYNPSTDIFTSSGLAVTASTVSTTLTSGALVVTGGVGIGQTINVGDNINLIKTSGVGAVRFWNSANTFYTGLQAGANAANYTLTLPTAVPGAGTSVLVADSTGAMAFVPFVGNGTSTFASNNALVVSNTLPMMVTFCAGYTPTASGADTVVFRFPENVLDGSSSITYTIRRVQMRVETLSSGTSTITLEKYGWNAGVGTGAFSTSSTGSTANVMLRPLNIGGVGMGETFVTSASIGFSGNGTTFVSGDKLRINFTALNATHANFSITALFDLIS